MRGRQSPTLSLLPLASTIYTYPVMDGLVSSQKDAPYPPKPGINVRLNTVHRHRHQRAHEGFGAYGSRPTVAESNGPLGNLGHAGTTGDESVSHLWIEHPALQADCRDARVASSPPPSSSASNLVWGSSQPYATSLFSRHPSQPAGRMPRQPYSYHERKPKFSVENPHLVAFRLVHPVVRPQSRVRPAQSSQSVQKVNASVGILTHTKSLLKGPFKLSVCKARVHPLLIPLSSSPALQWERADMYKRRTLHFAATEDFPFRGFVPSYRKRGDPAAKRRKKDGLLWAEQVMMMMMMR
jgi:hypothetical protein